VKSSVKIARKKTVTQAVHLVRKVEMASDSSSTNEGADDTEPENVNVHKHAELMGQDGANEDVNTLDLSEGEIFVPKKSRQTARKVKPSGEKDLKSKSKFKTKKASKKYGKQSKTKVDKKRPRIPLSSHSSNDGITKAKPVTLRTAV